MKKTKMLLFGYWENNLGDDLFLKIFAAHYHNTKIYILTRKKYKSVYSLKNICIIYDNYIYRIINKVLRFFKLPDLYYFFLSKTVDIFVLLGGSLFIETSNWKTKIRNLDYMVKNCRNTFIIGSNFGPFISDEYLQIYYKLFEKISGICFRDKLSCDLFPHLSNIHFAPDIVFNLKREQIEQFKLDHSDYYVISVINIENREILHSYREIYEKKIAEIANEIINNGSNVIFMSFCDKEGDRDSICRIQKLLSGREDQYIVYSHHYIEESLSVITHSNGIVATRFHAMILGFLYNKPVFPIVYSDKMKNVIKDYLFKNEYTSIENIGNLSEKDVFLYLQMKPNIPAKIFELAKEQFADLDNTLDKSDRYI